MLSAEVQERVTAAMSVLEPNGTRRVRAQALRGAIDRGDQPHARVEDQRHQAQHLPRRQEDARCPGTARVVRRRCGYAERASVKADLHAPHRRRTRSALLRRARDQRGATRRRSSRRVSQPAAPRYATLQRVLAAVEAAPAADVAEGFERWCGRGSSRSSRCGATA